MTNNNESFTISALVCVDFNGVAIVNLNKHAIVVQTSEGDVVFPPSGLVCTVAVKQVEVGNIGGIPIMANEYGEVENLPNPQEGVVFIVNAMVLGCIDRPDCVAPDTGPTAIRENGQVKKVIRFVSL